MLHSNPFLRCQWLHRRRGGDYWSPGCLVERRVPGLPGGGCRLPDTFGCVHDDSAVFAVHLANHAPGPVPQQIIIPRDDRVVGAKAVEKRTLRVELEGGPVHDDALRASHVGDGEDVGGVHTQHLLDQPVPLVWGQCGVFQELLCLFAACIAGAVCVGLGVHAAAV